MVVFGYRYHKMQGLTRQGYTLIELIVVMVLIGLILGLVGMNFSRALPGTRLKAAVRELSSTLRYAKNKAQIKAEEVTVTIDFSNKKYRISGGKPIHLPKDVYIMVLDPQGEEHSEGEYKIFFFPGGESSGAEVVLKGYKSVYTVRVDPLTGTVVDVTKEQ